MHNTSAVLACAYHLQKGRCLLISKYVCVCVVLCCVVLWCGVCVCACECLSSPTLITTTDDQITRDAPVTTQQTVTPHLFIQYTFMESSQYLVLSLGQYSYLPHCFAPFPTYLAVFILTITSKTPKLLWHTTLTLALLHTSAH